MKIVFITYWGVSDPLSVATVYPHLEILKGMDEIEEIHLLSFERNGYVKKEFSGKVKHYPIVEKRFSPGFNKFLAFFSAWKTLKSIHKKRIIDFSICRSSFAGILGYHLFKKYNVSFMVESLEPHTDYMITSGEWKKRGLKTRILRNYENKIFANAQFLLPVSENYRETLIESGVDEDRIIVLPCTIDVNQFKFNQDARRRLRSELNIDHGDKVGIYVGKFGGIYYQDIAFKLFENLNNNIDNLTMIVLTPEDPIYVTNNLERCGFVSSKIYVLKADPKEVPSFLSASDFGIAIYKESAFSNCLSPIKVGEYMVNGLPVVITKNIGEDSDVIEQNNIGVTFSFKENEIQLNLKNFNSLIGSNTTREKIQRIGLDRRGRDISHNVYSKIFGGDI